MATHQDFGKETSAEEVAAAFSKQIAGKIILITGVSPNGLGAATAHALAKHNPSKLIFTARTAAKAATVADAIKAENNELKTEIHLIQVDLANPADIRRAAPEIQKVVSHIDLIINNAGVMAIPERTLAVSGIESHLATNFLGHFLLTTLLVPQLKAADTKARVVNIVSAGFHIQPFRFSDYNYEGETPLPRAEQVDASAAAGLGIKDPGNGYIPFLAYAQSSTALTLFTKGLMEGYAGERILSYSAAPGVVVTELQRHLPGDFRNPNMTYKTPSQGVSSFLVAALDPRLEDRPAVHIDDCQVVEVPNHAEDPELARKLLHLAEGWLA